MIYRASCHCGCYQVRMSSCAPLRPRACGCTFCRRHGAITVSDPNGLAAFKLASQHVYRFGSKTTDYLVCPVCGVYIGAVMIIGDRRFATINLNTVAEFSATADAIPISYEGETLAMKIARRRASWTPVTDDWEQL